MVAAVRRHPTFSLQDLSSTREVIYNGGCVCRVEDLVPGHETTRFKTATDCPNPPQVASEAFPVRNGCQLCISPA